MLVVVAVVVSSYYLVERRSGFDGRKTYHQRVLECTRNSFGLGKTVVVGLVAVFLKK